MADVNARKHAPPRHTAVHAPPGHTAVEASPRHAAVHAPPGHAAVEAPPYDQPSMPGDIEVRLKR